MNLSMYQEELNGALNHLKEELSGLRTGRANASMVENIHVDAYGSKMDIKGLASITIPDAKSIVIDPWDKSLVKEVENAIRNSGKGLNPVNEGNYLRVNIPALTEESRRGLVKLVGEKAENARIRIRQARDKIKDEILRAEENNEIAEDDRFKSQDELDKIVKNLNEKIKEMSAEKEKEIMTV